MRRKFAKFLIEKVNNDKNIILVTADLGYGMFDEFKLTHPKNFVNCGASEQLMIGISIGAAYEGKIPICYSITPFLLYRPFELIRNYINKEKLNIKLIGSGRNKDYLHDGFSHWAEEDMKVMKIFNNITSYWPTDETLEKDLNECFSKTTPCYINLRK